MTRMSSTALRSCLLAFLFMGLGCSENKGVVRDKDADRVIVGEGTTVFPDISLIDWVSYTEALAVVTVIDEKEVVPEPSVIERMEGYIPRSVTLRVDRLVWESGFPHVVPPSNFEMGVLGWIQQRVGRAIAASPNAARIVVEGSYVIPFVRYKNDIWGPLTPSSVFAVQGNSIAEDDVNRMGANAVAHDLAKMPVTAISELLSSVQPDPAAVRYSDLKPFERIGRVQAEVRSRD